MELFRVPKHHASGLLVIVFSFTQNIINRITQTHLRILHGLYSDSTNISVTNLDTYTESLVELMARFEDLPTGFWHETGYWVPNCAYNASVAIIVPFRDREAHKIRFLAHMHPFLQRQCFAYQIFIIDQVDHHTFNRGKLMNVGYMQAKFKHSFTCYIFHDVDLLPLSDLMTYSCNRRGPVHMASAQDRFSWRLPYKGYSGGVIGLTDAQMTKTNGFSNQYWGWGAEDNDFGIRINLSGQSLQREAYRVSIYASMTHGRDKTNPVNKGRFKILKNVSKTWLMNGLNDLHYEIVESKPTFLYYYIAVDLKREMVVEDQ